MTLRLIIVLLGIFLLSGCGDKAELTEFGYAQAVALDLEKNGKFELTALFYNPTTGGESGMTVSQRKQGINITTQADTVFEAARDIPIHLGRKAKWDHMRIILIGEELARKQNVGEVLDFFSRDHEPRATVLTLITKGKASEYLTIKPYIESTIGQQLRRIEESSIHYSAKTTNTPLLDLAIQLRSQTDIAMVPYIQRSRGGGSKQISVAGIVVLKKGKMSGSVVTPQDTQRLLMLIDKYKGGIVEFACTHKQEGTQNVKESFEVTSLKTIMKPRLINNEITIHVMTRIRGSVGELRCSSLKTGEEAMRFKNKIKQTIENELRDVIAYFQNRRIDAFGIGDQLYRKHPALWRSMKPDWEEKFAGSHFDIEVEVSVLNTGMNVGTPFSK